MTTASSGEKPGTCPACGAENAPGSRFCERCGTRLPPTSREVAGPTPAAPTDATLTFDRPSGGTPRDAREEAQTTSDPPPAEERVPPDETAGEGVTTEHDGDTESPRDAPTMNFALPTLPAPEANEARNAPTLSFDLPEWAQLEQDAPSTDRSTDREAAPAPRASPEAGAPTEAGAAEGRSWDYQPWRPQAPEAQVAAPPPVEPGGTRPALVVPPDTPPAPPPSAPNDAAGPPQATGWDGEPPSPTSPTPGAYTYPAPGPAGQPTGQIPPGVGPGAPSAYGYPQGGATAWNPPNASAYPAPAAGNNNRTLWIILGVVGGLLVLCAMICVLVFLVGVASAASSGAVATGVATTTRP